MMLPQPVAATLNYIGSKVRIMPELAKVICPLIEKVHQEKGGGGGHGSVVIGDYFAGSGSVANYFQHHPFVKSVVACDQELYSYVINYALLRCVYTKKLSCLIRCLNEWLSTVGGGQGGLVWRNFSPGGGGSRMYFTEENARKIDLARKAIGVLYLKRVIGYRDFLFLLASILSSCSKCSNTASSFRAYLKTFSARSLKPFMLVPVHMIRERAMWKRHHVIKNDAMRVGREMNADIIYLDPPYTSHHYGGYYGFFNYLTVYRRGFRIQGISGGPVHYNKSAFGFKTTCLKAFKELLDGLRGGHKYIVVSYNEDGHMQKDDIVKILSEKGDVKVYEIENRKFKTHQGVSSTRVVEYLFVCSVVRRPTNCSTS